MKLRPIPQHKCPQSYAGLLSSQLTTHSAHVDRICDTHDRKLKNTLKHYNLLPSTVMQQEAIFQSPLVDKNKEQTANY